MNKIDFTYLSHRFSLQSGVENIIVEKMYKVHFKRLNRFVINYRDNNSINTTLPIQEPRVQYLDPLQADSVAEHLHDSSFESQKLPLDASEHDCNRVVHLHSLWP